VSRVFPPSPARLITAAVPFVLDGLALALS
jgi:hypothetical protein